MTEPRRPSRRRTQAVADQPSAEGVDLNPYRDDDAGVGATTTSSASTLAAPTPAPDAGADDAPAPRTSSPRPARRPRAARADPATPGTPDGTSADGMSADGMSADGMTRDGASADSAPGATAPHAPVAVPAPLQSEPAPPSPASESVSAPMRPAASAPPLETVSFGDATGAPNAAAVVPNTTPLAPRSQDGQARPHARHEGRQDGRHEARDGRRDNRHDGRHPRHERFDRQPQQDRAQHGPNADRFPDRSQERSHQDRPGQDRLNGAHGPPHGGADAVGGPPRRGEFFEGGGRRQRQRQRGRFRDAAPTGAGDFREQRPVPALVAASEGTGWVELARDGSGFVRQAANSYLVGPNDPFLPVTMVRANNLRAGDGVVVGAGRDFRQRPVTVEVRSVNGAPPQPGVKRPDFQSLLATYPERKLTLETGKVAKSGPELTRRIIDLIAPIGFGQRALIVAPARSGKTILLQNIVEGVALNHPDAELILLLVDERPEEVSEMVACGYGEVVASSFDMPADRHRDVVTMVMHRAQRLVEAGKDVVIVLDSITRMARAFNATKGIGRTLSGGLDAQAMATPKAFFGSARSVAATHGGGSITIIGTALVETGSRMDDVIFEEFKGTGNCEIKLDRNLAEQRIFPAIDVPASGTRREDKLFRPDQLDAVYLLRRGLQSMPASAAMNWLTKRIANTPNNDTLLATLKDT